MTSYFPENIDYRCVIHDLVEHLSVAWRCRRWDTMRYLFKLAEELPELEQVEEVRARLLSGAPLELRWGARSGHHVVLMVDDEEAATYDMDKCGWITPVPTPRIAAALLRRARLPDLDPFILLGPTWEPEAT